MPYRNYPPYIQRVMIERDDLHNKIDKLGEFMIDLDQFDKLDTEEQELLKQQFKVMIEYDKILNIRINKYLESVKM